MPIFRNTVWFIKGLREYTKDGYFAARKNFSPTDLDVSCAGKHFIVTGSNSGIGRSVATAIAAKGGAVHLVCRNEHTAEQAREEIIKETGNQEVFFHKLDLSKTSDIFEFAKKFQENPGQLDVLVNNAGCMVNTRTLTEDERFELNFATNTLGTFTLTQQLLPMLQKSSGRVVTVSSGGMLTNKLDLKDLQAEKDFEGTTAYAHNKRQQVIMMRRLAPSFPSIHFSSMHPGWADTAAVRASMPDFYEKMKDRLRTAEQGADTAVWLAVAESARKETSGAFFQDRTVVKEHLPLACTRSNEEEESKLMEKLKEMMDSYAQA